MKTIHYLALSSILILMVSFSTPAKINAQSLVGKWQLKGQSDLFHFSKEGAFAWQVPGEQALLGVWYIESDILGVIYIQDEKLAGYNILVNNYGRLVLEDVNNGQKWRLERIGDHEIPAEFIQIVVKSFGDGLGEEPSARLIAEQSSDPDPHYPKRSKENSGDKYSSKPSRDYYHFPPKDFSLVGHWKPNNYWEESIIFDQDGHFYEYSEDGTFSYSSVGLYQFDGQNIHMSYLNGVDAGESRVRSLKMNSNDQFTTSNSVFRKTNNRGLPENAKSTIYSYLNYKRLLNTWWFNEDEVFIFLTEFYFLEKDKRNHRSRAGLFNFSGHQITYAAFSSPNDSKVKASIQQLSENEIILKMPNGQVKKYQRGTTPPPMNEQDLQLYSQYLNMQLGLNLQATVLGIGNAVETTWKVKDIDGFNW